MTMAMSFGFLVADRKADGGAVVEVEGVRHDASRSSYKRTPRAVVAEEAGQCGEKCGAKKIVGRGESTTLLIFP